MPYTLKPTTNISDVRKAAWATRREKYGAGGHAGPYRTGTQDVVKLRDGINFLLGEMSTLRRRFHIAQDDKGIDRCDKAEDYIRETLGIEYR